MSLKTIRDKLRKNKKLGNIIFIIIHYIIRSIKRIDYILDRAKVSVRREAGTDTKKYTVLLKQLTIFENKVKKLKEYISEKWLTLEL